MQEFYHNSGLKKGELPYIVGLTASPIMSDSKQPDYNKIRDSLVKL